MKPGESREIEEEADGRRVGYLVGSDGTRTREIPARIANDESFEWPCHVAALDHGSVGAAGSSFVDNSDIVDFLHFTVYDKYHYIVRNNKNGVNRSGRYKEVVVQSSYVWGLNYKPYGSGEWQKVKLELLDAFLKNHDGDSEIVKKFAPDILESWGMPYEGTLLERENILERMAGMKSFSLKGSDLLLG